MLPELYYYYKSNYNSKDTVELWKGFERSLTQQ